MLNKLVLLIALSLSFSAYSNFSPIMDSELNSEFSDPMMEERMEDNWENDILEEQRMEEQRMEERQEEEDRIDYNDRTRTERERKALNTSSNASDDQ